VREVWAGIRRQHGTAPRQSPAAISEVLRDRSPAADGLCRRLRRSELVALDLADLRSSPLIARRRPHVAKATRRLARHHMRSAFVTRGPPQFLRRPGAAHSNIDFVYEPFLLLRILVFNAINCSFFNALKGR
jgi:hypothetical protein